MTIQEYISSGIVETYVLGLAAEDERKEFESMCEAHPEVKSAREAFEKIIEEQSLAGAVPPPAGLKNKIFSALESRAATGLETENDSNVPPVIPIGRASGNDLAGKGSVMPVRRAYMPRLAAAAVALLVLSTALNFYFFYRYRDFSRKYSELLANQTQLVQHNGVLQTRILEYEKAVDMMKDPGMAVVKMPAVSSAPDPQSATVVYWDTATKDVYLAVSKLPAPSANEQYQLWAMVDGKPVDAGVFDMAEGPGMFRMKNIPRAEAFAITLEKKGGSPTPNLQKLYVMGKV